MIGKVLRGSRVGGLLHYLYGPGRSNEHQDPHLVGSWDDRPDLLEPTRSQDGKPDLRQLTGLLQQPLALGRAPAKPVWHCALRAAPADRRLSDEEWRDVAQEVLDRTGLAPRDDDGGCRWVAVRHADDHIHLVVTLARQDGQRVSLSNDFYKVGEACRVMEQRLGLTRTAGRDRTAAKRPTRGESEKAQRSGRREPSRVRLAREVRTAASAATTADEFLSGLERAGLLVRQRHSELVPGQVTGYAVALPGDRGRDGRPVWFGGGKLASDLTWPKLCRRWDGAPPHATAAAPTHDPRSRFDAYRRAAAAAEAGTRQLRTLAGHDPAAAADVAHATGDALAATARLVEGRHGGPITDAAAAFDRASREPYGRVPNPIPAGHGLRSAARALSLLGRASHDETTQVLSLLTALAALSDAVAHLRDVQQRQHQAAAARDAAQRLRQVAPPRPQPAPIRIPTQRQPVLTTAGRPVR